jgi:molecular chaperone Hsp31 and glyoxalase 3
MTIANGKKFSTGNHPVEMLVPMMHLANAGFDIDVVTPTGAAVKIEMWAMPEKDDAVMAFSGSFKEKFDNPGSVADFASEQLNDTAPYVAVFLPGGHGAMLGLPENDDVGKIIRWCHDRDLHMLAICRRPAALLAANLPDSCDSSMSTTTVGSFVCRGYKIAAFPDTVDRQTPRISYMSGQMPWHFGERLNVRIRMFRPSPFRYPA